MIKPAEVFGRDYEWAALERFISDQQPGATLGVVSGRRRQGKTYLLEAVCEAAGGFYVGWFHWRPAMTFRPVGERRARPGAPRAVVAHRSCPERPRLRLAAPVSPGRPVKPGRTAPPPGVMLRLNRKSFNMAT